MAACMIGSMASLRMPSPVRYCRRCCIVLKHQAKIEIICTTRTMSTIVKNKTRMDDSLEEFLKTSPHRKHPGIVRPKTVILPVKLQSSIKSVFKEFSGRELAEKSRALSNYLWSRKRPAEDGDIRRVAMEMAKQLGVEDESTEDSGTRSVKENREIKKKRKKVAQELRKKLYHWKAIQYSKELSLIYTATRMAANYSAIYRIFHEIQKRVPDFKPKLLLDFGSGAGTTVWAANSIWQDSLREVMCVDVSADMNDLAKLLLKGGTEHAEMMVKGVFFRQFLPISPMNKFDIIVSAFTLMELSSLQERINSIQTLWRKTEQFLVIVENGTNEGYQIILEARDLILHGEKYLKRRKQKPMEAPESPELTEETSSMEEQQQNLSGVEKTLMESYQDSKLPVGHVFSPCSHHLQCPRLEDGTHTPCNFEQEYEGHSVVTKSTSQEKTRFSYIVFRKGRKREDLKDSDWPRVVRPVVRKSNHVHCHLCCANGQLQHAVVTASKHGKDLFYCARYARWGDQLPAYTPEDTDDDHTTPSDTRIDTQDSYENDSNGGRSL